MFRKYVLKRLLTTLIIFFIIIHFQFLFFWVLNPVDPVQIVLDPDLPPEYYDLMRHLYGVDEPLHIQYIKYITNLLTFNFGISFRSQQPVAKVMMNYLPNSLALVLTAVLIQIVIGVAAGLYAARKHGGLSDVLLTGGGLLMWSMPPFLILLAFRYLFAEKLGWFPVIGAVMSNPDNIVAYLSEYIYRIALPLITTVLIGFGYWAFYIRNLSIEIMTQDFIQTARAKGVTGRLLIFKHVLWAILPPIVTMVLMALPLTIFGSFVTEYVFTWKGIGWWYLNSLYGGDYPAIMTLFYIYSIWLLLGNLVADFLYGYIDPRIRVGVRK